MTVKTIPLILASLISVNAFAFGKSAPQSRDVLPPTAEVNLDVMTKAQCANGGIGLVQLNGNGFLTLRVRNAPVESSDSTSGSMSLQLYLLDGKDLPTQIDENGQITITGTDGQNMVLGTYEPKSLVSKCQRGKDVADGVVQGGDEVTLASDLSIKVFRSVGACSHMGIVWHSDAYRAVSYEVVLERDGKKIVFTPDPKSTWFQPALTDKFMYQSANDCEAWTDRWNR